MLEKNKENPIELGEKNIKKKYISLKTTKILCDKEYQLEEGEPVPADIKKEFLDSLVSANLITIK